MKCPVCGFENENDSQFCGNCGTPLIPEEPEKKGSKKTPVIIAVVPEPCGKRMMTPMIIGTRIAGIPV